MTEHLPWWPHHLPILMHSLASPARKPESPPDWAEFPIRSHHQEARTSPDHTSRYLACSRLHPHAALYTVYHGATSHSILKAKPFQETLSTWVISKISFFHSNTLSPSPPFWILDPPWGHRFCCSSSQWWQFYLPQLLYLSKNSQFG